MSDDRKKLRALNFTEKIRILDKLRARSLAFAEARKKLETNSKDETSQTEIPAQCLNSSLLQDESSFSALQFWHSLPISAILAMSLLRSQRLHRINPRRT